MSTKKLSLKEVNQRLKGKTFKLIKYSGLVTTKSTFQCYRCDFIWESNLNHIFGGSGCPQCAKTLRKSSEIMKTFVESQGKILVSYSGDPQTKSLVMCGVEGCGFTWETTLYQHLRSCPKCLAERKLIGTGISLIRYGGKVRAKHTLKHDCGFTWESGLSVVPKCPKCRLKPNKIKVIKPKKINYDLVIKSIQKSRFLLDKKELEDNNLRTRINTRLDYAIFNINKEKSEIEAERMQLVKRKLREIEEENLNKTKEEKKLDKIKRDEIKRKFSTWESTSEELSKSGFKLIRHIDHSKNPQALAQCNSCQKITRFNLAEEIVCPSCGQN